MRKAIKEGLFYNFLDFASSSRYCRDDRTLALRNVVHEIWREDANLEESVCIPVHGRHVRTGGATLREEDFQHICRLLTKGDGHPVHILLYGPPGTGKTSFAASLTRHLGLKAWAVPSRVADDEGDRRASLCACMNVASRQPGSFVIADEAERLLDTAMDSFRTTKDKAWLNSLLERPGSRVIWITNRVGHIDAAVLRRFSFSVRFDQPGVKERRDIWRAILARHRAVRRLSAEDIDRFAAAYPVSGAVIEKAVVQAKALADGKKNFSRIAAKVLQAHAELLRPGGTAAAARADSDNKTYSLDGVSLESSPQELLAQCRQMDSFVRQNRQLPPGGGCMLFYGPPGTGKTALARYIAGELDRECVLKKASDLLGSFVGESEKRVAEAFREAEQEDAILVFDEADSFLYARETAQRSWETTFVNEFLTGLENFRGICICTTNRRENMDAAAMRRFSFKVPFQYAKAGQIRALYASLLAPLAKGPLPEPLARQLCACARLAPGDFHAVRSSHWLANPGSVTHESLVQALLREQALKLEAPTRKIGF